MLYVRFEVGDLKRLARVEKVRRAVFVARFGDWADWLQAWVLYGESEFLGVSIDVSAWLDVYQAPLAASSNVAYYGNGSALSIEIGCPGTYYWYSWLPRLIRNIGIPTNNYTLGGCTIQGNTLTPTNSLKTIVPTQVSSFI